ncbi:hypothetical protein PCANC_01268 [Puccinia coronata f. sp. avenae]|uniref:Uncharacterized protein n=1 Tax=Puccinia coronata f. sp. avenae TaxID=200324 RepID=A0A2N5RXG9_9BASI|nr:hypothetical protein PCASD_24665 [Puccinia coronata f. sp. avenae]PLW21327.1 hypothetical protein PCANC_05076 [Puccinia coronata f. sp. avenae]PLW56922.1 hypothetical protein PCANC_01268 [Puccinia coronata f. sp. avenae]
MKHPRSVSFGPGTARDGDPGVSDDEQSHHRSSRSQMVATATGSHHAVSQRQKPSPRPYGRECDEAPVMTTPLVDRRADHNIGDGRIGVQIAGLISIERLSHICTSKFRPKHINPSEVGQAGSLKVTPQRGLPKDPHQLITPIKTRAFSLLTVVLAALPSSLMAQNTVSCFNSQYTGLNANHCRRALRNIVYDTNGRLDNRSSNVFTWHKTCVINVQKVAQNQPTRVWLESAVIAIAQTCRQSGGIRKYPDGTQAQVYRSTTTNVYGINQPVCQQRVCNFQPNDCLHAFNKLAVNRNQNFIFQNTAQSSSQATWGNCTVLMQTTDSAAFRITRPQVDSSMKQLSSQCGSHAGNIYISGGTEGNNGDVRLSTQGLNC